MPTFDKDKGRIKFSRSETESIAEGADVAALLAPLISTIDPTGTGQAIYFGLTKGLAVWARSAVRRNKCLGLDAAQIAAGPVLALAPAMPVFSVRMRLHHVRDALSSAQYYGLAEAQDFEARIQRFCGEHIDFGV